MDITTHVYYGAQPLEIRQMVDMKTKYIKMAALAIAIAACGLVYTMTIHAQQNTNKSGSSQVTTNWVGYLVAGQNGSVDPMPGTEAQPTTDRQVEIGLRSDGVVIWREAPMTK